MKKRNLIIQCNLASYFDEPKMPRLEDLQRLFLSDPHHPSSAGHLLVTFLLLKLLRGTEEWPSSKSIVQPKLVRSKSISGFVAPKLKRRGSFKVELLRVVMHLRDGDHR